MALKPRSRVLQGKKELANLYEHTATVLCSVVCKVSGSVLVKGYPGIRCGTGNSQVGGTGRGMKVRRSEVGIRKRERQGKKISFTKLI